MKINNWIFHAWWQYRLKKVQSLQYRAKMETEALVSNCVLDIQNDTAKPWTEIKHLLTTGKYLKKKPFNSYLKLKK